MINFTREAWLKKVDDVCKWAKDTCTYGNSQSNYPCADHLISCDRLAARAAYDLGVKDQAQGGFTTLSMYTFLPAHGCKTITRVEDLQAGDMVEVSDGKAFSTPRATFHVFVIKSIDHKNHTLCKWDLGSNERIKAGGYFGNVPFTNAGTFEWGTAKPFWRAWRWDYKDGGTRKNVSFTVQELKKGDNNNFVRLAKRIMIGRGLLEDAGSNIKIFDDAMQEAVKKFQKSRIKSKDERVSSASGNLDAGTWKALISI